MYPAPLRELTPVSRVACALLQQVVSDLHNPQLPPSLRADAMRFVRSPTFLMVCRVMQTIDPDAAREKLLTDVAARE